MDVNSCRDLIGTPERGVRERDSCGPRPCPFPFPFISFSLQAGGCAHGDAPAPARVTQKPHGLHLQPPIANCHAL